MSPSFRVSAKALITLDQKVLLLRKPDGKWGLPGGRLEANEEPAQAMVREVLEETGLSCTAQSILHSFVRPRPAWLDILVIVFNARTEASFADIKLSIEHDSAGLFQPSELPSLKIQSGFKRCLEVYYNQ